MNLVVNIGVAPNDKQSDRTGGAGQVDDSQLRCLLEIDDKALFENTDSGRCSLMLLRCNSIEAQVLVVEWQDARYELQGTARRIGILRFGTEQTGKENPAEEFRSCFSI